MKPVFTEANACISKAHCVLCREVSVSGKAFRKSLKTAFTLPEDSINFDCPHGKEWGTAETEIERATDCKYVGIKIEDANPDRPCVGCKITCSHPENNGSIWWAGWCNKYKCKFYAGKE